MTQGRFLKKSLFMLVIFTLLMGLAAPAFAKSYGGFRSGGFRSGGFKSSFSSTKKFGGFSSGSSIGKSFSSKRSSSLFKGFSTKRSNNTSKSFGFSRKSSKSIDSANVEKNAPNTGSFSTGRKSFFGSSKSFSTPRSTKAQDVLIGGFSTKDQSKSLSSNRKSFSGGLPPNTRIDSGGKILQTEGQTPKGKQIIINRYPQRDILVYGNAPWSPVWYNNNYWGSPWWFHMLFRPNYHWWGIGPWGWGWWSPNPFGWGIGLLLILGLGLGLYTFVKASRI